MQEEAQVLLLPGWQNSTEGHWQTEWEQALGYQRVQQHDWLRPRRGDWCARLEEAVLEAPAPVVLAAHSLGCILVAWWAAHSRHTHKVRGALLVAPGDVEQPGVGELIPGWLPIARQPLPFAATLVASSDDPYCSLERAHELAARWGARFAPAGACGHMNAESALGLWPQGQALLRPLMNGTSED